MNIPIVNIGHLTFFQGFHLMQYLMIFLNISFLLMLSLSLINIIRKISLLKCGVSF